MQDFWRNFQNHRVRTITEGFMQIDMHYYGVYVLARLGGLNPEAASFHRHFVLRELFPEHKLMAI